MTLTTSRIENVYRSSLTCKKINSAHDITPYIQYLCKFLFNLSVSLLETFVLGSVSRLLL